MEPTSDTSAAGAQAQSPAADIAGWNAGRAVGPAAAEAMTFDLELDKLTFNIDRSLRYHQRRIAHYDRLHRWSMFLVVLTGSAAFGDATGGYFDAKIWGLVAAILGATDLAFAWSSKARDHQALYKRFSDLAIELRSAPASTELVTRLTREQLKIEADEPPTYWLLEADTWNETTVAWGREKKSGLVPLSWLERVIKHFYRCEGLNRGPRKPSTTA